MSIPHELYKQFGRRVARFRKKAKLSQVKLARAVGLSRSSIANIERGRQTVQIHVAYLMADALGEEIVRLLPNQPRSAALSSVLGGRLETFTPEEKRALEELGPDGVKWFAEVFRPKPRTETGGPNE